MRKSLTLLKKIKNEPVNEGALKRKCFELQRIFYSFNYKRFRDIASNKNFGVLFKYFYQHVTSNKNRKWHASNKNTDLEFYDNIC